MFVIAHAGHWAIGAIEAAPLLIVGAFAAWRTYGGAARRVREAETPQSREGSPASPAG